MRREEFEKGKVGVRIAVSGRSDCREQIVRPVELYCLPIEMKDNQFFQKILLQKKKDSDYHPGYKWFEPTYYFVVEGEKFLPNYIEKDGKVSSDTGEYVWVLREYARNDISKDIHVKKAEQENWEKFTLSIDIGIKESISYNAVILCYLIDQPDTFGFLEPLVTDIRGHSQDIPIVLVGIKPTQKTELKIPNKEVQEFCKEKSASLACQFSIEGNAIDAIIYDVFQSEGTNCGVGAKGNTLFERAYQEGEQSPSVVLKKPSFGSDLFKAAKDIFSIGQPWGGINPFNPFKH